MSEYCPELKVKDSSSNSYFATHQLCDLRKIIKLLWDSKNSDEELGFVLYIYIYIDCDGTVYVTLDKLPKYSESQIIHP